MNYVKRMRDWLQGLDGRHRLLMALVLGFVSALSLPPVDAWPLLFLTIPAFFALADRPQKSWRSAFSLGWCFGFGYFLWTLHWIGFAFLVDAADYLWMMPFAVGGLVAFLSLYWGAAVAALHASRRHGLSGFLIFVVAMGVAEHLRGVLLTGFPWGAPGLAAIGMGPVSQLAAWCGMEGLTLLILLWAGVWPFALKGHAAPQRLMAALLLASLPIGAACGGIRLALATSGTVPSVTVRLVQPNIPQSDKWRGDNMAGIFDRLMALSSRASPPEHRPTIIIWPESAVPYLLEEASESRSLIGSMLGPGRLLISGSLRRIADASGDYMKDRVFNSVLVINGDGEVVSHYDKWKLVPGGEFLPFEPLLGKLGFRKVVTLPGSFEAGEGPVALALPGLPAVGLSVCYEAIFPGGLVNQGDRPGWLANVTNDGWFGRSIGPYAHFAQARLRAIEQGLPLGRAANTGLSGMIDAYGRVTARSDLETETIVDAPLPAAISAPLYARMGLVLPALLALGLAGLAFARKR